MSVNVGFIKKEDFLNNLKKNLDSYEFKNEKNISSGIQSEIWENGEGIGIVRIYEGKKGTTLDLSQILDAKKRDVVSLEIQKFCRLPERGQIKLPRSYMLRNDGMVESIKELIEDNWSSRIVHNETIESMIYSMKLNGVSITQWLGGKLLIQGSPSSLSDELVDKINKHIEDDTLKEFLRINESKFKNKDFDALLEEIKSIDAKGIIPDRLYFYLYPNDKIEIVDALRLIEFIKKHDLKLENYVSLVRNVSVAFEGFLIKIFIELGLINESQLLKAERDVRIGKILNKAGVIKSEFENRYGDLFLRIKPHLGSKLDSYWKECRNRYLHSDYLSSPVLNSVWEAESKINELVKIMDELLETFDSKLQIDIDQTELDKISCIGTDESGKGDFFGPLTVASVFVDKKSIHKLLVAGVMDSKEISEKKIFDLEHLIKNECVWDVVTINPKRYNELYNNFKNLNKMLAWGHSRALENILMKVSCKVAIADQFGDEELIKNALMSKGKSIKLIQMPKAEKNVAVAAASILARAEFLRKMEVMEKSIGIKLHKGSSDPSIVESAIEIKNKYGLDKLHDMVKTHFKTMKNVL